jgi:hypothetical protein
MNSNRTAGGGWPESVFGFQTAFFIISKTTQIGRSD